MDSYAPRLFPSGSDAPSDGRADLRVRVEGWDDTFLWGRATEAGGGESRPVTIMYAECSPRFPIDGRYLRNLLYEGATVLAVRPAETPRGTVADFLVLEPDLLVDISSIAASFEAMGATAELHLINRFRALETTVPILLGNLAGQLLDEAVTSREPVPYAESARRYFSRYAVSFLEADITPDFHREAQNQQRNIRYAVDWLLGRDSAGGQGVRRSDVVLEPSFVAPRLGLQGRMDLLSLDYRLLVEQKSGKAGWPTPTSYDQPPTPQQKHSVQVLLYELMIRYCFSPGERGADIDSYLLYSKYPYSLCQSRWNGRLVAEAMRLRNCIVRQDLALADGDTDWLCQLRADDLNWRRIDNKFWRDYLRPSIEAVLRPIRQATPSERAYFCRFLAFQMEEQRLTKMGTPRKAGSGFASTWLDPLEVKMEAGNIYCRLTLEPPGEGAVETVTLQYEEEQDRHMSNFRAGDVVMLYPYPREGRPDATATMVLRCTVESIGHQNLQLRLRSPQSDARVFDHFGDCLWAMEHDFIESAANVPLRALHAFLVSPEARRDLLLLRRRPRVDKTRSLLGSYRDMTDVVLRMKQAQDLFLLVGPPGTGKTSRGMYYLLKETLREEGTRVLLVSFTNRAVDEMCDKLLEHDIDFLRLGHPSAAAANLLPHLLENRAAACRNVEEMREMVGATRVFAATTATLSAYVPLLRLLHFDLAIVDEASQILEPQILPLLTAASRPAPGGTGEGRVAIDKFVLIGDHKQLPAIVRQTEEQSAVTDPLLLRIGLTNCRRSFFERMIDIYGSDPALCQTLTRQGRMHREIADFPNQLFYEGRLEPVPLPHQLVPLETKRHYMPYTMEHLLFESRFVFVDVPAPEGDDCHTSDKVNLLEARVIARLVDGLRYHTRRQESIGIIVPYRNQVAAIYDAMPGTRRKFTVDTVERFQGSQRDIIIFGFTARHPYQLDFLSDSSFTEHGRRIDRRLNVALTRARERMIIVGNASLLRRDPLYERLIEYARSRGGYFTADEWIEKKSEGILLIEAILAEKAKKV